MEEQDVTIELLVAYASGELDESQAARVEAYLAVLPDAARDVSRLRDALEAIRDQDVTDPSPEAVRRALAAFAEVPAPGPAAWVDRVRRVLARLVFDSRQQVALSGYRGMAPTYQLAYESERGRVDLQVLPRPGERWRVRGQLSAPAGARLSAVHLVEEETDRAVSSAEGDELGRFKIESGRGTYDLVIETRDDEPDVVVPGIEIGQP